MAEQDACVVVPVYNEASVLADVLAGLVSRFEHVICIDDGSADASASIVSASGAHLIRHSVNLGQGAALQTGFEWVAGHTSFAHLVTFDADGQHDAGDAFRMLDVARSRDLDVVLGSRSTGSVAGQPRARRWLLQAAVRFSRLTTGLELSDTHNGLRVLSRFAFERIELRQHGMAHASELEHQIARLRLSWGECPVSVSYTDYSRTKGQGNLNSINILADLLASRMRVAS